MGMSSHGWNQWAITRMLYADGYVPKAHESSSFAPSFLGGLHGPYPRGNTGVAIFCSSLAESLVSPSLQRPKANSYRSPLPLLLHRLVCRGHRSIANALRYLSWCI